MMVGAIGAPVRRSPAEQDRPITVRPAALAEVQGQDGEVAALGLVRDRGGLLGLTGELPERPGAKLVGQPTATIRLSDARVFHYGIFAALIISLLG